MLEMKLSLIIMDLIAFQSTSGSPRSIQMASRDSLTSGGGLGSARISARCCFRMDFTAIRRQRGKVVCKINTGTKHARYIQNTRNTNIIGTFELFFFSPRFIFSKSCNNLSRLDDKSKSKNY